MPPTPDATAPGAAAPDRGRADVCPGALRLHTAADGGLARVRLPGGLLTEEQALALADAALALGDGNLEITSRGNVQLRGLASDCGAELAARLRAAGLLPSDTHERVRNIVASPGLTTDRADGRADVHAWARELDAKLCASPWAAGLSGKFLFVLDDGSGDVAALNADVTLIAGPDGSALVRLARSATGEPVSAARAVDAALAVARDFLAVLRATGREAWHLREVPDLLPVGSVALPAFTGAPPVLGALSGGLSVAPRFGSASAAQWRALVDAAEGELRLTPWRGAVLPGAAAERLADLAAAGFRTAPGAAWERATACTGLPGCAKSLADVRADATRALDAAEALDAAGALDVAGAGAIPVHWSGCERRCGHPTGRWVDVLATGQGYRVTPRTPESTGAAADPAAVEVTNEETAEAVAEARRTTK
ncbi:cobalamin biosynthesis protein CobG [Kitasatospora sp. NPDC093806]|uniref:cobalamin biosynthesis protein CobG n=1 Tax=Kitasatospora sp. NPDC093806 TaxID=3155075 RepID=UPI0034218027